MADRDQAVADRPARAVVFDYGGVLTTPVRDSIRAWLERDRIDPDSFSATLKAWLSRSAPAGTPIHRLETGALSVEEFDALLAAELRTVDGGPVSPERVLSALFAEMRQDPAMWQLARDLRAGGTRIGLLSNSWGNTYPRAEIDELFDPVVISSEVGMRKPERAVFELTLKRLGLDAHEVVFVDDADANLEGARAEGLRPVLHTDAETTRTRVTALVSAPGGRPC